MVTDTNTQSLSQILSYALGGDWGKDPSQQIEGYVPVKVIRGTEISKWNENNISTAALRLIKKTSLDKRKLSPGDIVIEISGGGPNQPVGRTILIDESVNNSDIPVVCSNFFRMMRLKNSVYPKYIKYALDYQYHSGEVNKYQTSSTNLRNLNFTNFIENVDVPDIDLRLQKITADKIEELETLVWNALQKTQRVKRLVQKFRQAVLSTAVTGKLTEDWREINTGNTLVSSEIKKDIFAPSKIDGWVTTTVGKLYKSFGGGTPNRSNPSYWNGKIPWVSSGDVKEDYISKGSETITQEGLTTSSANLCLINSVIVVVRSGILKHTLPVSIVKGHISINQDIKCFDSENEQLNYWLFLFLKGRAKHILLENREGTTVQSVKYDTLKNLEIIIPSFKEQKEITSRVESFMRLATQAENQIQEAEKRVDKLTQSILAKAFRGELL